MPIREAAEVLGVSKDAVRQRIRRGTLRSDKGEDGRVYVYLDATGDDVHTSEAGEQDRTDLLIAELQDRVRSLEEANRENRRIIAALTSRIPPAIEAPSEARETAETVDAEADRGEPRSGTAGTQEGARRPWWRRVFGGG